MFLLIKQPQHFFSLCFLREWNIQKLMETAQKVLPHPSFVYCAQYHPSAPNLVVSGSYDCLIRVWRLDVDDATGQLLQEFEGHSSFINTLCFDFEGILIGRLFIASLNFKKFVCPLLLHLLCFCHQDLECSLQTTQASSLCGKHQ